MQLLQTEYQKQKLQQQQIELQASKYQQIAATAYRDPVGLYMMSKSTISFMQDCIQKKNSICRFKTI